MKDLPINLGGYRLMVTDAPQTKVRENKQGELEAVTNRVTGEQQFVVSLFAKPLPGPDGRAGKGEEISVNLTADPGEFELGSYVELIDPVVNHYAIPDKEDPGKIANAGMWFRAAGMKPAGSGGLSSAA